MGVVSTEQLSLAVQERRRSPRRPCELHACLLSLDGYDIVRCQSRDLSEDGISVSVPVGFGLAVGQRYEVLLSDSCADMLHPRRIGEGFLATVVRARLAIGPNGDRVGVGLRFDRPLAM